MGIGKHTKKHYQKIYYNKELADSRQYCDNLGLGETPADARLAGFLKGRVNWQHEGNSVNRFKSFLFHKNRE